MNGVLDLFYRAWLYALGRSPEFMTALGDHMMLIAIALGVGILVSVPLGVWTSRSKIASLTVMNFINGMRVIPSLAILFLVIPYLGLSTASAAVALVVLAMPPILINTDAAFRNLDAAVLEAARGMGMTAGQILKQVEFPLALPVILTGIRTATVEVISSATLAAFVGSGGFGIYITRGFQLYDYSILLVGAVPVALLTLVAEGGLSWIKKVVQYPE